MLQSQHPALAWPRHLLDRLLASLEWTSTVFHVGQYCGRWEASTAGRQLASFHLVLDGACFLHRPGREPLPMQAGDAVFFLQDEAHRLSSSPDPDEAAARQAMQPTWPVQPGGTSLACGFFEYRSPLSAWLARSLSSPILLRGPQADDPNLRAARALFSLMREEAAYGTQSSTDIPTPALARLVDLLLLYLLRHAARTPFSGAKARPGQDEMAHLIDRLLADPSDDWTVERMAAEVHMSRAVFFRRFQLATGEAPAQFLLRLRMVLAAECLQRGDTVERTAEHAGYQSTAAFHRAFQRVMGELPGHYRRLNSHATLDG